jgi:glycerate 2-kinase
MSNLDREAKFRSMRDAARRIFQHALAEASIAKGFARNVHCERGILRVCDDLYQLHSYSRVFVVSLGKAGHTMVEALSELIAGSLEGIVASSAPFSAQVHGFRYFRGGHPTPNAESVQAANAMLRALHALPASALVIFLLSGGGSSIVEKPIDDEVSLDDLVATYHALVLSGAPIA